MKAAALLVSLLATQLLWAQAASSGSAPAARPQLLTIESLFTPGGITGRAPEDIKWSPDGQKVSFLQRDDSGERGTLYYVDVATGSRAVLVAEQKLATLAPPISALKDEREQERITRYSIASYDWAPDSKRLLFDTNGQLWLYTLSNGTAVQLTSSPDRSSDPKFSPDGSRLAYVRKHNLYVRPVNADEGERQITREASEKTSPEDILNGEVDWVYAEELDVRSNYFWSPDSKQIVFLQMNERLVPSYPLVDWIPQHPKVDQEKYPKAGDANPEVRLGVVNAGGGGVKWITVAERADREYIPRFGWVRPGMIWIQILNRAQNKLELWFAEANSGKSRRMLTESEPEAWVPVNDNFRILPSGNEFLWSSWRDGHTHLYLYSFNQDNPLSTGATLERQLTKGDFEVSGVDAVDGKTVYFTANAGDPRQRQVFAMKLDGSGSMQRLSVAAGTHHAIFSPSNEFYVDKFSTLLTPPVLSVCKTGGECRSFWQSRSVAEYSLIAPRMLELKAADGATTLYGTLLMPAHASGKVPLILNPYGGPQAQLVADVWAGTGSSSTLFDQILARSGFAVLKVDNRGMGGRGKAFAAAVRRRFGEVELADQLAALQQVLAANPQLDAGRVGLWGWSYGGYLTLYAMTHSDRFRAGIAVAPVSDWLDYDSIYTERYLGVPMENSQGYKLSSPVNAAAALQGRLLEVHGTSDDNVHVQNTMQMVNALINAGVQFDLQLYPRKTHAIAGQAARTHLFNAILQHFQRFLANAEAAAGQSATH
jgi:dipeptidyl-peptidase-4